MIAMLHVMMSLALMEAPPISSQRCQKLRHTSLWSWVNEEAQRLRSVSDVTIELERRSRWIPDVQLLSSVTLNEDNRFRLTDDSEDVNFRTTSQQVGGQRSRVEVRFSWYLATHRETSPRLSLIKLRREQKAFTDKTVNLLITLLGQWLASVSKNCKLPREEHLGADVFELELRLNDLTSGRFYQWLKEN